MYANNIDFVEISNAFQDYILINYSEVTVALNILI